MIMMCKRDILRRERICGETLVREFGLENEIWCGSKLGLRVTCALK